jgi:hypothetical protein
MSKFTRRSIPALLAGLVGASTTTIASTRDADPVFVALDAYAQARADWNVAFDHHQALEREHREVAFYQPRVQVGYYTTIDDDDQWHDWPIYARTVKEIEKDTRDQDTYRRAVAELKADEIRHAAQFAALGLKAASEASDVAGERLYEAEVAVLETVPTTTAGALALVQFAKHTHEERGEGDDVIAPLSGLFVFLTQSAGRDA